ncbi:MAG: TIGR03435 family protein [Acidobacteriaceae bacterium]
MSSISLQGSEVIFAIKSIGLTYRGTLNPDGNTISGSSTQGKQTLPLNLQRVSEEDTWAIPEPTKPMAKDAQPDFEVATIKPSKPNTPGKTTDFEGRHFTMVNYNVNDLLSDAYGLHTKQIFGAPAWFDTELYDIDGVPDVPGEPNDKQAGMMLQKLLADRFALKFHREQRELSVFAITVAKGGPKMTISAAGQGNEDEFSFRKLGDLTAANITMDEFATEMQGSVTDRPVVDRTGLKDRYDFKLWWTPDDSQFAQFRSAGVQQRKTDKPSNQPALKDAIQQQIGLRIDAVKAMVDVIVIDHVEHPSPN